MADDVGLALRIIGIAAGLAAFAWLLVALVKAAKRGGKGFHAVGAALMLFGWGNLRDPGSNPVAEARDGRVRKDNETGDPPAS
jgi:hypothetical protein